jgi:hypothetical protein
MNLLSSKVIPVKILNKPTKLLSIGHSTISSGLSLKTANESTTYKQFMRLFISIAQTIKLLLLLAEMMCLLGLKLLPLLITCTGSAKICLSILAIFTKASFT